MFDLQPPRHISTLRISPVVPRPREGPLTEPTAGAQRWLRERVFMPFPGILRARTKVSWNIPGDVDWQAYSTIIYLSFVTLTLFD